MTLARTGQSSRPTSTETHNIPPPCHTVRTHVVDGAEVPLRVLEAERGVVGGDHRGHRGGKGLQKHGQQPRVVHAAVRAAPVLQHRVGHQGREAAGGELEPLRQVRELAVARLDCVCG